MSEAISAATIAFGAFTTVSGGLTEALEHDRTISDAMMYGMDRSDAIDLCNEFNRDRQGRSWADFRDELVYMCIGGEL